MKRTLWQIDHLSPSEWEGEFSDGSTYYCRGCGILVQRDLPVVILVDDERDLETYYHPSCYVLSHPDTELSEHLLYQDTQEA